MTLLLGSVLAASLVGSLHCAGMCGPFVTFYAGTDRGPDGLLPRHLAYNSARLLVYAILGAIAGTIGTAVDLAGRALSLQRAAAVVAGCAIMLWGAVALLHAFGVRLPGLGWQGANPAGRVLVRLRTRPPVIRAAVLGLLTGALPCGWLYAFAVSAAGTGSWFHGTATMAAFWLGTLPMMLGIGLAAQRLARLLGRRLPALTAVALIAMGLAALVARVPQLSRPADGEKPTPSCHGAH